MVRRLDLGGGARRCRLRRGQGSGHPRSGQFHAGDRVPEGVRPHGAALPGTTANGANARIVFVAPDGQKITAADNKKTIDELVDDAADGSQVAGAVSPFQANAISKDATTAYATITYKVKPDDLTDARPTP